MAKKGIDKPTGSEAPDESGKKSSEAKVGRTKSTVRKNIQTVVSSSDLSGSVEITNTDLVNEYLSFLAKLKESKSQDPKIYTNRWVELEDHPERVTCSPGDLNNFHLMLDKNGHRPRDPNESPKLYIDRDSDDPSFCGNHSALLRNGVWQDFFDAVVEARNQLGISEQELNQMIEKDNFKRSEDMYQELIPLYLLLRKKGYSNRDLVG